jgi:hypothetical protein
MGCLLDVGGITGIQCRCQADGQQRENWEARVTDIAGECQHIRLKPVYRTVILSAYTLPASTSIPLHFLRNHSNSRSIHPDRLISERMSVFGQHNQRQTRSVNDFWAECVENAL